MQEFEGTTSCIFRKQETLGHKNEIFDGGKTMLVLIFFMHKVEALPTNYRMPYQS
jgi:hypothetical protein